MDAGDDNVHLGEGAVVEIELAFGEDVYLDAGEDSDAPLKLGIDFADALDVGERAGVIEAVCHSEVLAVIGDGDVGQTAGDGGFGHLADGVAAVGGFGVHVEVAANIGKGDESG